MAAAAGSPAVGVTADTGGLNELGRFSNPCRVMVCGPSQSGKSTFIRQVVKFRDLLFETPFDRIVYSYAEMDASEHRMQLVQSLQVR